MCDYGIYDIDEIKLQNKKIREIISRKLTIDELELKQIGKYKYLNIVVDESKNEKEDSRYFSAGLTYLVEKFIERSSDSRYTTTYKSLYDMKLNMINYNILRNNIKELMKYDCYKILHRPYEYLKQCAKNQKEINKLYDICNTIKYKKFGIIQIPLYYVFTSLGINEYKNLCKPNNESYIKNTTDAIYYAVVFTNYMISAFLYKYYGCPIGGIFIDKYDVNTINEILKYI